MKKKIMALILIFILINSSILLSYAKTKDVVIISPSTDVVYCDNLLISIKVLEGKSLKVSVYSVANDKSTLYYGPDSFSSDSKLNFYTTQIDDIKKGSYNMVIETTDSQGKPEIITDPFTVKDKTLQDTNEKSTQIFETQTSSTLQFVQNVLKSIFSN